MDRRIHSFVHFMWISTHVLYCRVWVPEGVRWIRDSHYGLVCEGCKVTKKRLGKWA